MSVTVDTTGKLTSVFGRPVQQNAVEQMINVLHNEHAVAGALMADHHLGYSIPVGGVVAFKDAISVAGVGYDIACGNKAVRTNMLASELGDLKPWMRMIQKEISFGLDRREREPIDHPLFDNPVWSEIDPDAGQPLKQRAARQLGTVGGGNHYVDMLVDDEGWLWIACHFGSRGLGHTIASGFLAVAAGKTFSDRVRESDDPAVLPLDSEAGQLYQQAMELAGEYAYAGRDWVIDKVVSLVGSPEVTFSVHCHHNYAWLEDTDAYGPLWFVRKGATPLTPEHAFIGGSMGDISVIVRGRSADTTDEFVEFGGDPVMDIGALGSAPHGAGRVMSRTAAAGKLRKMWVCNNRNCTHPPERAMGNAAPTEGGRCPVCDLPLRKVRMRDPETAAVDWQAERAKLAERGIVVLGAGADESPVVYKQLGEVLDQHRNVYVEHVLRPIGVVMASPDTYDPYRD